MSDLILLFLISTAAFTLKAMTGFGPAIILICLGSFFFLPQNLVPLAAILDLAAGIALFRTTASDKHRGFWIPLAIAIVIGSVIGGLLLNHLSVDHFKTIMSVAVFFIGATFLFGSPAGKMAVLPGRPSSADGFFSFFGGICGGLIGIDGPPLVWHFGQKFSKKAFRQVLVPVFAAAALARVITYGFAGMISIQVLIYCGAAIPGLMLGIFIGNRVFIKIDQTWFERLIGFILMGISIRHLW